MTFARALEQSAAENALPVEFFARVIWQESLGATSPIIAVRSSRLAEGCERAKPGSLARLIALASKRGELGTFERQRLDRARQSISA
jgi:hypothetical protein